MGNIFRVSHILQHILQLLAYFNSNILYSVHLFCTTWFLAIDLFSNVLFQTFDYFLKKVPTKLLTFFVLIYFTSNLDYVKLSQ